jgi:hypothetical protein
MLDLKFADRIGFGGPAPEESDVYSFCSQKVFPAPAGQHIQVQMSLLTELARFFLLGLYTFRAAGAFQLPNPQIRCSQEIC